MIEEAYVSYKTAKLLKEKGFEQHRCQHSYDSKGVFKWIDNLNPYKCSAPTQQMTMRWLREVHNIDINIYAESISEKRRYISSIWKSINSSFPEHAQLPSTTTYEKAAEAAIKYCLENLI